MTKQALQLPAELRQALDRAVQIIVEQAQPQLIILFGSWAEGTARPDSDVDLLVVVEAQDRYGLAADLQVALEPLFAPRPLDVLVVRPGEWESARKLIGFVTYEADRWGARLYERAA